MPGSPGPNITIPTSAINAAAAMRMPGRWYHDERASLGSAVWVPLATPEPSPIFIGCPLSAAMTVVQFRLRCSRFHRARPLGPKPDRLGIRLAYEPPADKRRHLSNRGAGTPVFWPLPASRCSRPPANWRSFAGFDMPKVCLPGTTRSRVAPYSNALAVPAPVAHTTHPCDPHGLSGGAAPMSDAAGEPCQQP